MPLANSLSTLAEKESRSSLQEGEGTLWETEWLEDKLGRDILG